MRWNRVVIEGLCTWLAVAGLATMQWKGLRHLVTAHETFTVRRINRLADRLLGQAHRTKDDILLQQTVQAIALMPGVSWAAIVDPQYKILAHSDPSQLGKTFRWRARSGQWLSVLEDGRQEWGRFVFGFSDASFRRAADHETVRQVLLFVMGGFVVLGLGIVIEKGRQQNDARIVDGAMLLEEEKARSARLELKVQNALSQNQAWLQEAMGHVSGAALFLDSQQRIAAINDEALSRLGFTRTDDALLKSWHEVPILQSCGALLEQSLQSPLVERQAQTPVDGMILSMTTLKEGSGTWVAFFPSKRVVK
jgi:PAS domain-containing protein